jgi:hypothetical protein
MLSGGQSGARQIAGLTACEEPICPNVRCHTDIPTLTCYILIASYWNHASNRHQEPSLANKLLLMPFVGSNLRFLRRVPDVIEFLANTTSLAISISKALAHFSDL